MKTNIFLRFVCQITFEVLKLNLSVGVFLLISSGFFLVVRLLENCDLPVNLSASTCTTLWTDAGCLGIKPHCMGLNTDTPVPFLNNCCIQ